MLKKAIAISMSLLLSASIGTSTFAAVNTTDVEKTLSLIEKTNADIEAQIEEAVRNADDLQAKYLQNIQRVEEEDEVTKLKDQKRKLEDGLQKTSDVNKVEKIKSQLAEVNAGLEKEEARIEGKIKTIQDEIDNAQLFSQNDNDHKKIDKKITKLKEEIEKKSEEYSELTEKFSSELQGLIDRLFDSTYKMSSDTIKRASEKGIVCERYWTHVTIGGREVLIDPIRVIHKVGA